MTKLFLIGGSAAFLASCSIVGPDYQAPSMDLPAQYVAGGSSPLTNAMVMPWWEQLNDPILNELVVRGAVQNIDVRSAIERITAAQSLVVQTGTNAQTAGGVAASAQRQDAGGTTETVTNVGVNAVYVIDLFGNFARGQERSIANYEAAQLDVGTVRLAYLADLTNSYVQARYYQEAAAITRQTIASRRQTLAIVNQRRELEEATELEVQQARSLLASAQAPLPILVANFEINVYHMATLLAEPAAPLLAQMQAGAPQPRPSGITTTGLPADLLRNRPDVRVAERNFAAATAQIGVAEAQLYPSVELSGTLGAGTNEGWSFGPSISVPVLNRGLLRARREAAASNARVAELTWRNTVLQAVEEVQVALTLCRNWSVQLQYLRRAAASSAAVLDLSRDSYRLGESSLTDVLDAERIHASNRLALADARRNLTLSWMRLQVATGNGWRVPGLTAAGEIQAPDLTADPAGLQGTVLAGN